MLNHIVTFCIPWEILLLIDSHFHLPSHLFCTEGKQNDKYWSVSNFSMCNIQSLAKYQKMNFAGFSDNNIAKFIDYQILANTFILKLK